jgi:hypothetical protein
LPAYTVPEVLADVKLPPPPVKKPENLLRDMKPQEYEGRKPIASKLPPASIVQKLANRTMLPVPDITLPNGHVIPVMANKLLKPPPRPKKEVRRVTSPELEELLDWAVKKFEARWPNATKEALRAYALMANSNNMYGSFRTDHAWGIVFLDRHPLDPKPIARVLFIVSHSHVTKAEASALAKQMRDWAKRIGAGEFQLSPYVDVNPEWLDDPESVAGEMVLRFWRL